LFAIPETEIEPFAPLNVMVPELLLTEVELLDDVLTDELELLELAPLLLLEDEDTVPFGLQVAYNTESKSLPLKTIVGLVPLTRLIATLIL
jgi:hypothetical protein